ncbi:ABC transporter [Brevirhabdus pacifica]|uniref:ABC transporter n=2 Tax=Brevirhabdus pacifica TaxID=1267768 RepID=A0A1U7DJA2_9RHOB|nr:ABC transporter substrate-binding protein [Brevirhabdus pacifica]APX90051.1 ABC transporter [Brevirhabdus pacifica]OWU75356.1 ABC transporter [Loktanella sp. 22II-4b]PJJ82697.1 phospholipid transport system substrate-binding protein [Brevirhabdus pacifica]
MTRKMTRRDFAAMAASSLLAMTMLGRPAAAAISPSDAQGLVQALVDDIFRVIESGRSESAILKDFDGLFAKYADVEIIARQVLGADSRRATPAQMRAFTDAFRGYIARKYGKRFREFIGGRIDVQSAAKVKSFHEVRTMAHLKGEAPFEVKFLVSDKSGRPRFFNMLIEGVNLMLTETAEIGARLDQRRGDIDALIRDLRTMG